MGFVALVSFVSFVALVTIVAQWHANKADEVNAEGRICFFKGATIDASRERETSVYFFESRNCFQKTVVYERRVQPRFADEKLYTKISKPWLFFR